MSAIATPPAKLWTLDEFLALPDDGKERWLIRGQLRVSGGERMTKRNRFHTKIEARIAQLLGNWLDGQPEPRGEVHSGEVGIVLRHDPETTFAADVVYVPHGVVVSQTDETTMIDGVPSLAVEILSPSNTIEEIDEKVDEYLAAGVPLIWTVHPRNETVTVHYQDRPPEAFDVRQTLSADPHLPGFTVPVAKLFRR